MRKVILATAVLALSFFLPPVFAYAENPDANPPTGQGESPDSEAGSGRATEPVNLILNGDFENTTVLGCSFGLPNSSVNMGLGNVNAFGDGQDIDVMNDLSGCGFLGPPQSGVVKLGISSLSNGGEVDALSMELSLPVEAGTMYSIEFWAWAAVESFSPDVGAVEVGLSSDPNDFGVLIFQGLPSTTDWTLFTHLFTATNPATYLTVRAANTGDTWNHIDNFSLRIDEPMQVAGATWGRIKQVYR